MYRRKENFLEEEGKPLRAKTFSYEKRKLFRALN